MADLALAGPSEQPAPLKPKTCAVCTEKNAIYSCPRCLAETCSFPCSTAHKTTTGCSGVRDKAKYVPMKDYGLGTLMDDYVYLEEMGRKVYDVGREIARGGFGGQDCGMRSGRGRLRGRGQARGRGTAQTTKRDVLKIQLELRDIDVDMLPAGMERRAYNQSTWDFKNQTALLTIEFKFHVPPDACNPNHTQDQPYTLLTHRNSFDTPLLALLQSHIRERRKTRRDGATPSWVKSLVLPYQDVPDLFTPPQFFMLATVDTWTLHPGTKAVYHRLEGDVKLSTLLKHKHFVEFPTVEVWEEGAFHGSLVDVQGGIRPEVYERPVKRRKLTTAAGKKAMSGLLGAYGSDEEDERPLELLGDYAESDAEIGQQENEKADEANVADEGEEVAVEAVGYESDREGGELGSVEYALLMDLLQMKPRQGGEERDDPEVDWGESDGGEGVL